MAKPCSINLAPGSIYLCHVVRLMPTITIYLTNELYDKVRMSPSKIVRAALEHYFEDDDAESASESEHARQRTHERTKTHAPPAHH